MLYFCLYPCLLYSVRVTVQKNSCRSKLNKFFSIFYSTNKVFIFIVTKIFYIHLVYFLVYDILSNCCIFLFLILFLFFFSFSLSNIFFSFDYFSWISMYKSKEISQLFELAFRLKMYYHFKRYEWSNRRQSERI